MLRKQHWLYGLLLFLVTSVAMADDSGNAAQITSDAVSNHTDLSMNFLSQLFGTVGNSLSGTSGQMLGKLFYELNVGILVVAGLWMSYTVVTLVFGAATEGGFMSGRNNLVLAFLKIAIGIGMLIPSPTTGYSVIQDMVMKVVVESVKLADMTWSHGLDYIQQGGAVWTPPATESGGALNAAAASSIYDEVIQPTFNAEVCMIKASVAASQRAGQNAASAASQTLNPINAESDLSFYFPNNPDKSGERGCGTLNWGAVQGASSGGKKTTEGEYAYEAAYKVVYGLLPAAKNYACAGESKVGMCAGMNDNIDTDTDSEVMFNNLLAYANSILPLVNYQTAQATGGQAGAGSLNAFLDTTRAQGWIMAGRYSWDLSHMKDQVASAQNISNYKPDTTGMPGDKLQTLKASVLSKFDNYSQASNAGNYGSGGFSGESSFRWIEPFVGSLVSDIQQLASQFSSNMGHDPIYFLHRVGVMCISIAGDIWLELAVVAGSLMLIGIICSGGALDLDKPIGAAIGWFKPLAMAIAGLFITTGGMLAFYVPVYAFFIFTFGVIAWFILVIEAMVAAPLVAFGMTHPQGHDFLGKVEQSLMLLLGVFLRPVLMVIGLIAAMILSYIAFRITNFGFASFMSDIFSTPTSFAANNAPSPMAGMSAFYAHGNDAPLSVGKLAMIIIGMPVLLLMYSTAVCMIVNQCYSLVYRLPDYIMRWIGGPQSDSGISQMMEGIKGMTEKGSGQLGQGAGETTGKAIQGTEALGKAGAKGLRNKFGGQGKGGADINDGGGTGGAAGAGAAGA